MLFSKDSKSKKVKKNESSEPAPSTVLFTGDIDSAKITITLTAIQSAAGGYVCEITNIGRKNIVISRFCVNNFANAIRNTGVGRNFYGLVRAGDTKKFNISFTGYELANRDPVLFNFLWHADSVALFVDDNKKPFKIDDLTRL